MTAAPEPADDGLQRQVERGSLFTHTALSDLAQRTYETESLVLGLVDVLLGRCVIEELEVSAAARRVRAAMDERGDAIGPGLALRIDDPEAGDAVTPVDCAGRMHVCHAVCCKLQFALSAAEVEAGKVKWDLGRPYIIRHEPDGGCTHCDRESGACTVYADRPGVCRTYSCAGDARIWKDFDAMILNQEWIDENLVEGGPRLAATAMIPVETLERRASAAPPPE